MQVNFAVGCYAYEAVKTVSASGVVTLANAETAHFAAVFPGLVFPVIPVKHCGALVQRFIHVRAGNRFLVLVNSGVVVDRIDSSNLQSVDAQFPCSHVHDGRHRSGHLVLPGPALCAAWRGIGQYGEATKAHRSGIVDQ